MRHASRPPSRHKSARIAWDELSRRAGLLSPARTLQCLWLSRETEAWVAHLNESGQDRDQHIEIDMLEVTDRRNNPHKYAANAATRFQLPEAEDFTGRRYGLLLVVGRAGRLWECLCDCGNRRTDIKKGDLLRGAMRSCGCRVGFVTHGLSKSSTYRIWRGMLRRCRKPNDKKYYLYGGRGIDVCERWNVFENFLSDMGLRPAGKSLDRVDNSLGYSPSNCRWATPREQVLNSSVANMVCIDGRTQCVVDWCREFRINSRTVYARIRKGLDAAIAITTPVLRTRQSYYAGDGIPLKGVGLHPCGKYKAACAGKYLGLYDTAEDAARAYDAAAAKHFGASARLNFPEVDV